jgi:opacity protein-like surface antigen
MNGKLLLATVAAVAATAITLYTPAHAADVVARPYLKAPPPIMLYNWTGFYVGAHFGGAFSSEDQSLLGLSLSTDPSGVLGGLQYGYNYQFAPDWLVGVEGELSWTSANGSAAGTVAGTALALTSTHNWYDTLAARFGYVQNNWLFYAKVGAAWMNADYALAATGVGASSFNATRPGFVVGAGAEYAFTPNWSAKLEYEFLDFGNETFGYPFGGIGVSTNINTQVHEIKVGVNYHFVPGTLFGRW